MGSRPLSACLLVLLAVPAFADCSGPTSASENRDDLQNQLRACFPKTEAPEVELLNIMQVNPNDPAAVSAAFLAYINDHDKHLTQYQLSANGGYAENVHNAAIIPPADIGPISALVGQLYVQYRNLQAGGTGIGTTSPAPAATGANVHETNVIGPNAPAPNTEVHPAGVAELMLTQAASQTRDPSLAAQAAQMASTRGDSKTALEIAASVGDNAAPNAALVVQRGEAEFQLGQYAAATQDAAAALKLEPENKAALALYHASDDRVAKVRLGTPFTAPADGADGLPPASGFKAASPRAAASAANASPQFLKSQAAAQDAEVALKLNDMDAAAAHANTALELDPNDARAMIDLAVARLRQGRDREAVDAATAALALAPGNPLALETRLWALGHLGRYREALADADQMVLAQPAGAFAHYGRAYALAGLGDRAGALAELKKAAALDAGFDARYQSALQLPQDGDMTMLFGGGPNPAAAPAASAGRRSRSLAPAAGGAALLLLLSALLIFLPARRRAGIPALFTRRKKDEKYELVRMIGAGGMGVVYEARDRALNRRVAVKKIREEFRGDARERARFVQEARTVARLKHPHIVEIYAIAEEADDASIVFELVEGRTVHDRLRAEGPYGFAEALKLFRPMCEAVACAHAASVVHRDLKPANVMVTSAGLVKVMDFGAARRMQEAPAGTQMTNTIIGTPSYMAPEQEQGAVRRESDVFALAACFYEMTTGRPPFDGAGAALSLNKLQGKILPAGPSLPPGFDAALAPALSPDPAKRPRAALELLAALEALAAARA